MSPSEPSRPAAGFVWLVVPAVALVLAFVVTIGKPLYAVAAIGALIAVPLLMRSPKLALLLTLAAIPLEEAAVLSQTGPLGRISFAKIFGALAVASWLGNLLLRRQPLHIPRTGWIIIAYVAVGVVSLFGAIDPAPGRTMVFRWINTILFFLLVVHVVDSWKTLKQALMVFVVVSTAVAAFAVVQRALPSFQYEQRGAQEIADEVTFGAQKDVLEQDLVGGEVVRAGGTSYHPLILALNCTLLVPLLVVAAAKTQGRLRLLSLGALAINLAALLASGSRSGLVSFLGVVVVLTLKRVIVPNRFLVSGVLLAAIAAWPLIPSDIKERLFSADAYKVERSSSLTYRVEMVEAGFSVWSDHPLLGAGLGNLTEVGKHMRSDVLDNLASGVHNMYLQVGLETGIAGLAMVLWFFVASLRAARELERRAFAEGRDDAAWLAQALSGCIWAMLIFGLSLDVMNFSLKNAWFLLALLPAALRLLQSPSSTPALHPRGLAHVAR